MPAERGAPRGLPTSRAYWELQAEKLLNRVFDPADPVDLLPLDDEPGDGPDRRSAADEAPLQAPEPPPARQPLQLSLASPPSAAGQRQRRARRPGVAAMHQPATSGRESRLQMPAWAALPQPLLLVAVFAGAGLITATSGVLALSQWNRFQEALQQERNLLLVERLRSFGPAVAQPAAPTPTPPPPALAPAWSGPAASGGPVEDSGLPPPPPSEAWIEELASLPQARRPPSLLRVPLSPALGSAAVAPPPAPARRRAVAGPVPLLVGLVAVPGKPGAAIFQLGGSTSTVAVGEGIGNSGWRLIASNGDSVQIENQGEVRRLSIGAGG